MPGMDGMEATRRIMARHPTPVLFLSSFFDKEGTYSRARCDRRGRARRRREAGADARLALAQRRRQARAESEVAGEGAGGRAHSRRAQAARAGGVAARIVHRPSRRRRRDRRVFRRTARDRSVALGPAADLCARHRRRSAHDRRVYDEHAAVAAGALRAADQGG